MKLLTLGLFALTLSGVAHADKKTYNHLGTAEQREQARVWNRGFKDVQANKDWQVARPFSEVETSGYVAISGDDAYELPELREAIAKNLPADAALIVYVTSSDDVPALKSKYSPYLGEDRLKFLVVPQGSDPIWARDSLPFPVYMQQSKDTTAVSYGLVDSIYPQNFEPDAAFAKALSMAKINTKQYFRGGNLLIDSKSNCFLENVNEVAELNDPVAYMKDYFGCATVNLLDQEGGIGDIDERIKFLGGMEALTDNNNYAELLKAKGYNVHRIPQIDSDVETYMNTLLINGTMFVPQMGINSDKDALDAYTALGFKAVGVNTKELADQGAGNIHCVTMNYPPGAFKASLRGADFVEFF